MTSFSAPICMACLHRHIEGDGFTCDAFPDGIPDEIIQSEADHREPFPGDQGIQFEEDPTALVSVADLLESLNLE